MGRGPAVGAVLLVGLVGAAGYGYRMVSPVHPAPAELLAVPGATARYPGAKVYDHAEVDGHRTWTATEPASVRDTACAGAPVARVRRWYDATLGGAGWKQADDALDSVVRWKRGDRRFDLVPLTSGAVEALHLTHDVPLGCRGYVTVVR